MRALYYSLLMCGILPLYAQHSISGTITDHQSGDSLAGVIVYIPDLGKGTSTDMHGYYRIDQLPSGKLLIVFRLTGYRPMAKSIQVERDLTQQVNLEPGVAELDEIIITGTSKASEIRKNPMPVSVIDMRQLNRSVNTNLIDAIAKVPGVSAISSGPGISKPVIRGLGSNRVLTLYNGIRQEGQQWGDEHGIEIDEYSIERVEVIKGPASLSYGSDAIAGVINLLPPSLTLSTKTEGTALINFQANNKLIATSTSVHGGGKNMSWNGTITNRNASNFENPVDGKVFGTSFHEIDITAGIGIDRKWGNALWNFAVYDNTMGVPDGSRDSLTRKFTQQLSEADSVRAIVSSSELNSWKIPDLHQHVQHYRTFFIFNRQFTGGNLSAKIGYQSSIRREYSHPAYLNIPGLDLRLHTITYDVKWNFKEFFGIESTTGINGMIQSNVNKGTEFLIPDYVLTDLGPFLLAKKSEGKFELAGGVRYDLRLFDSKDLYTQTNPTNGLLMQGTVASGGQLTFSGINNLFKGISSGLGASYSINRKLSFKCNLGRAYRAPNVSELSSGGIHPGTSVVQIGNIHMKPEFSLQGDFGLLYSGTHLSIVMEAFTSSLSNYIFNQRILNSTGTDSSDNHGNKYYQFQQTNALLYGGEFTMDIHPHPFDWLHLENSLSMVYGQRSQSTSDSDRYLPFIPPLHTRSEIRIDFKQSFASLQHAYIKLEYEYYSSQHRVLLSMNTETTTPSYHLIHAGIGADVVNIKGIRKMAIYLNGTNLLNTLYQSNMSRLKYMEPYPSSQGRSGIYNMGRNVSVKLIWYFG